MNIFDKLGSGLAQSIDTIIDKNRQCAQLNRLNAVIRNETEALNRAYIALGKQYYKILEGNAESADMSHICAVIEASKLRLKKAKARYDYIEKYGIPGTEQKRSVIKISADEDVETETDVYSDDDEDADITIAYADSIPAPQKPADTEAVEISPTVIPQTDTKAEITPDTPKTEHIVENKEAPAAEIPNTTVAELKRKRAANYAKKKVANTSDDAEAANDNEAEPIV